MMIQEKSYIKAKEEGHSKLIQEGVTKNKHKKKKKKTDQKGDENHKEATIHKILG